jgi:hypothetical protein
MKRSLRAGRAVQGATLMAVLLLGSASVFAQGNTAPGAVASPMVPAPPPDASSQKARKLIDQMVTALGGQAWLTYKNIEQEGRSYSFFQGKPTSAGTLFWRFYEYPDRERRELTKQRDVVYIYVGDKGYEKTFKGTATEEDKVMQELVRRRQHSLDTVMREWLKDPQTVLLYVGQSVADQQLVDVVSILNKDNQEVSIGIDINNHLPINIKYTYRDSDKYKVEEETVFGNYRTVQGIATPYTITRKRDGEISGQNFLSHVDFNRVFEPGFFDAKANYNPETYNPRAKKK